VPRFGPKLMEKVIAENKKNRSPLCFWSRVHTIAIAVNRVALIAKPTTIKRLEPQRSTRTIDNMQPGMPIKATLVACHDVSKRV